MDGNLIIDVILLLCLTYLMFFKDYVKGLGVQFAKLTTQKDLTTLEERVKFEFNEKFEKIKQENSRNNISHQIQYAFLQNKRGDAILKLHENLIDLQGSIISWTSPVQIVQNDKNKEDEERLNNVNSSFSKFRKFYFKNKLLFSEKLCNEIENLFKIIWEKSNTYIENKSEIKDFDYLTIEERKAYRKEMHDIHEHFRNEIPKQIKLIEKEFRTLLSVE